MPELPPALFPCDQPFPARGETHSKDLRACVSKETPQAGTTYRYKSMSFKLSIETEADHLALKVSGFKAEDAEMIGVRLTEIAEVLNDILASDEAASDLTEAQQARLTPALSALELKYKLLLQQAAHQAAAARSVAQGHDTISEHGFPEFDDV